MRTDFSYSIIGAFIFLSLILTGSGFGNADKTKFLLAQAKKPERIKVVPKEKTYRVDFRDQEIQDFLKAMSAIIGKNIVTDERVKGKITVISPKRIPVSMAYAYMTSVLAVRGFGIVEENEDLIRVVPIKDALAGAQVIHLGREPLPEEELIVDAPSTHVVPLLGSKPSRLAPILKRLTSANTEIVDFDEAEMIIITGNSLEVNRLVKITSLIDGEPGEEPETPDSTGESIGNVHVFRLEYMQSENIEATLKKIQIPADTGLTRNTAASGQPANTNPTAVPKKPLDVVAHKESNSLVFIGNQEEFELVKGLLKRMDIPRDQVLLEVLIVEITADDSNSFGIDWIAGRGGSTQFNSGLVAESGLVDTNSNSVDVTGINALLGFSLAVIDNSATDIAALLNANLKRDNFAVISAPQVLTLDNQEAEINVGQDVPVITGARTDQLSNVIQQFEYRPVGVKLKFTPQISKNQKITLNLFQEVKSVIGGTGDATSNPTFSKRDLKTVVRVDNMQTIVIGGLISTDRTKNVRKIPVLGEIPLLGYLFKRSSSIMRKTNLLVFITPHILTRKKIADKVTDDLKKSQNKEYLQHNRSLR
ncbi:MAG: type II secretion system protein GspD [Leptospiraceae bacterium]|nr:type II secretion system protein GspD [Leptospiraceae bacterium]